MALSKKKKRRIIVGENVFYWMYKFEKDILRLTVLSDEKTHSRLICDFRYKDIWLYFKENVENESSQITSFKLTPNIVRQVIEYGIANGWKPFTKAKNFIIDNLEDNVFPFSTDALLENCESAIRNPKSEI